MQAKTIKKTLDNFMGRWVDSIEDIEVRTAVWEDTLITGGCIASMLLQEPVNDYDVYFTKKETALLVAQYYVDRFKMRSDIMVIDCEETGRIKLKVPSEGMAGESERAQEETDPDKKPFTPVFISENAITFTDKLQIIVRFFGDPEKVHESFDYAHAMCWYKPAKRELHLDPLAMECMLTKTLRYKGSLYPICSLIRMRKFINRGWCINAGEILMMCWQVSKLDLTNREVLREQLTGVDALYFQALYNALMNIDLTKVDDQYVCEVIDTIFN